MSARLHSFLRDLAATGKFLDRVDHQVIEAVIGYAGMELSEDQLAAVCGRDAHRNVRKLSEWGVIKHENGRWFIGSLVKVPKAGALLEYRPGPALVQEEPPFEECLQTATVEAEKAASFMDQWNEIKRTEGIEAALKFAAKFSARRESESRVSGAKPGSAASPEFPSARAPSHPPPATVGVSPAAAVTAADSFDPDLSAAVAARLRALDGEGFNRWGHDFAKLIESKPKAVARLIDACEAGLHRVKDPVRRPFSWLRARAREEGLLR